MGVDPSQFLGLAFAAADLLLEIDGDGLVTFAVGAGRRLTGCDAAEMIGRPLRDFIVEDDRVLCECLLAGLQDGERGGPVDLRLGGCDTQATAFSAFRVPHLAPRISCALTPTGRPVSHRIGGGLYERGEFEALAKTLMEAARTTGPELELALIEFAGLEHHKQALGPDDQTALGARMAGALRAEAYVDAAVGLGAQRFALLRRKGDSPEAISRRLKRILGAAFEPTAHTLAIDPTTPGRMMRALRFAMERFVNDGAIPKGGTLSDLLGQSIQRTVAEAGAFGALVEARKFKLVYQPVVSLADGGVHHFEALVRFHDDHSPFAMIRMAEELDIIENLDRAVTEEVVKRLAADTGRSLRLAVNVSGRTITSTAYMQAIETLGKSGELAGRLMFEVTESAAIEDLALAQRHIQAMQAMGFQVCLDDFGSGAASFAYLRQLSVDVVKIDGSYVRELTAAGRDDTMIRHLVGLCRELGVTTVAEMVETEAVATVLRSAGVDYAQGWLYGQPVNDPAPAPKPQAIARRRGAVEQWG